MARVLGLDYGERRIGLALSDPSGTVATPWRVLTVDTPALAVREIVEGLAEKGVERVVIGLPLRMDGGSGPAVDKARAFGDLLVAATRVPVTYWDERFSTVSAQQALLEGGARRRRRKEVVDKLAAQIFLQHYLDAQAGLPDVVDEPV